MVTAETLEKAIAFAVEKHKNVRRKGDGRPYILHPLSVLHTLLEIKKSKNAYLLASASALHDTVEDCEDVTLEIIAKEFGYAVAAIVEELTSVKDDMIKKGGKTPYLIEKMINMSSYSLCIKLVDRLDNIKDMKSMSAEFIKKQITSTSEIIQSLEKGRKLSKTHKKIIKLIKREMKSYEKDN